MSSEAPAPIHLFVYGTLRRAAAHPMHRLLDPAMLVGHGTVPGRLYHLGTYPGVVLAEEAGSPRVCGEVYRLHEPAPTLARLDRYEGCAPTSPTPHEYRRVVCRVCLEDGSALPAWVYLYARSILGLIFVPSGDWLQR